MQLINSGDLFHQSVAGSGQDGRSTHDNPPLGIHSIAKARYNTILQRPYIYRSLVCSLLAAHNAILRSLSLDAFIDIR
jgi:hypothetical protein